MNYLFSSLKVKGIILSEFRPSDLWFFGETGMEMNGITKYYRRSISILKRPSCTLVKLLSVLDVRIRTNIA